MPTLAGLAVPRLAGGGWTNRFFKRRWKRYQVVLEHPSCCISQMRQPANCSCAAGLPKTAGPQKKPAETAQVVISQRMANPSLKPCCVCANAYGLGALLRRNPPRAPDRMQHVSDASNAVEFAGTRELLSEACRHRSQAANTVVGTHNRITKQDVAYAQ
jgi:hypothetical protein